MNNTKVTLAPLAPDDREQFILDNQWAFKYGAMLEFGGRDDHIDDDGEIISRDTIERCVDDPQNETYRIVVDGKKVGGVILKIDQKTHCNELEILFTLPDEHSKGIGYGAWQAVEALHPETVVWNNVNAPGENFGSHRGRFFVFLSDFVNRVATVRRAVLPRMLHPHGAWGSQPQQAFLPYGYQ